jgi:hypothetical protein
MSRRARKSSLCMTTVAVGIVPFSCRKPIAQTVVPFLLDKFELAVGGDSTGRSHVTITLIGFWVQGGNLAHLHRRLRQVADLLWPTLRFSPHFCLQRRVLAVQFHSRTATPFCKLF